MRFKASSPRWNRSINSAIVGSRCSTIRGRGARRNALDRKHLVNNAILALFAEKGIQFAYPTQTTFTAAPDGRLVMPFAEPKTVEAADAAKAKA